MRLIEERRGGAIISYVYEPGSYVPLARLDADGEQTQEGGLGTKEDADLETAKTIAASASQTGTEGPNHSKPAANDAEGRYWASLNAAAQERAQTLQIEDWGNGTTGQATGTTGQAELCKVYYFHTDQVGMPQELSNSQGQLVWQASYKTWGSTVAEEWEIKSLSGNAVHQLDQGDSPDQVDQQQNLRFQGQYLDRETGLHYNTFRYYDADIGRFISPDPIGLNGGINLGAFAANPLMWIDPLGLMFVYRSVSMAEYEALKNTGVWNSNGTMEGKWFATTYEDAVKWGSKMGHEGGDFKVIQVDLPSETQVHVHEGGRLDGIGPAVYVENAELNRVGAKVTWSKMARIKC